MEGEEKVGNNARVKLTADLIETASKHGCEMPKEAILAVLNATKNMEVFNINNSQDATQTVAAATKLIEKREAARKDLY